MNGTLGPTAGLMSVCKSWLSCMAISVSAACTVSVATDITRGLFDDSDSWVDLAMLLVIRFLEIRPVPGGPLNNRHAKHHRLYM